MPFLFMNSEQNKG